MLVTDHIRRLRVSERLVTVTVDITTGTTAIRCITCGEWGGRVSVSIKSVIGPDERFVHRKSALYTEVQRAVGMMFLVNQPLCDFHIGAKLAAKEDGW